MSTSNSTNFSTDRDKIINGALRLVGAIGQGETGTSYQISEAAETLNMMVKHFMTYGMPLWAVKSTAIPLVEGVYSYSIGIGETVNTAKPLKIYNVYIHNNSTGTDVPVNIISRQEWIQFGNKVAKGHPVNLYYDPQNKTGVINIYPSPSAVVAANNSLVIVYQRPFEDFDSATDEPDFPQEWFDVVKYGLAVRLAGEYGLERFARKTLQDEFQYVLSQAQGFNQEEVSLYLQVDTSYRN